MSEFDKLKDDAERYAKDHPEQVHEAEQAAEHAAESKFGIGGEQQAGTQQDEGDGHQGAGQQGAGQQGAGQQGAGQQNTGQQNTDQRNQGQ